MDIKTVFERIAKEYPEAKKQKLKNHPLTKFIRTEVPKSFREDLGETISKYGSMAYTSCKSISAQRKPSLATLVPRIDIFFALTIQIH